MYLMTTGTYVLEARPTILVLHTGSGDTCMNEDVGSDPWTQSGAVDNDCRMHQLSNSSCCSIRRPYLMGRTGSTLRSHRRD